MGIIDQGIASIVHMVRAIEVIEAELNEANKITSKTILGLDPWALHEGYPIPHTVMLRVIEFHRGVAAFLLIMDRLRTDRPVKTSLARAMARLHERLASGEFTPSRI